LKCPSCKEGSLFLYQEKCIAEHRKITTRGTISKRIELKSDKTYGMPDYLECDKCGEMFDYDVDESDKIIEIWEKNRY